MTSLGVGLNLLQPLALVVTPLNVESMVTFTLLS